MMHVQSTYYSMLLVLLTIYCGLWCSQLQQVVCIYLFVNFVYLVAWSHLTIAQYYVERCVTTTSF